MKHKNILALLAMILLIAGFAAGQERATKIRSGVPVRGVVGGEGHQSYVIRVGKRRMLTLQILRRVPKGGNFNLTVSRNADFADAEEVKFGKTTSRRTMLRWTGRVPVSGNYYIYLTGFNPNDPNTISYRLTATVSN